jgi:hypothetical protein
MGALNRMGRSVGASRLDRGAADPYDVCAGKAILLVELEPRSVTRPGLVFFSTNLAHPARGRSRASTNLGEEIYSGFLSIRGLHKLFTGHPQAVESDR